MLLDIVYTVIFILLSLLVPKLILRENEMQYKRALNWLIIYHFVFAVIFYLYITKQGGDALGYWAAANKMSFSDFKMYLLEGVGTRFMESFNYVPVNIMGMSFFANSMLYGFFGSVGICFFYITAVRTVPFNVRVWGVKLFPLIFFIPNLHFWSAGVGKDTLLFMSVGLFSYALLKPLRHIPALAIGLILATAIRPHITLLLLVTFGLAYLFGGKTTKFQRIAFSILLLGAGIALLPVVTKFIGVEELSSAAISKRSEGQVGSLAEGSGSAVDVNSYPFPLKVFTYLYRPLFFDARSAGALLSSLDNLILLLLSFHAFRFRPIETFRKAPFIVKGFLIFGILGTIAFSASLGNLGVMVRMKNMFTPGILIYFMWCYSYRVYIERVVPQQLKSKPSVRPAAVIQP